MITKANFTFGPHGAIRELTGEIAQWWQNAVVRGGVVGLSGGIDSATVIQLMWLAAHNNRSRERVAHVVGVVMPSSANHPMDGAYGIKAAQAAGITHFVFLRESDHYLYVDLFREVDQLHFGSEINLKSLLAEHDLCLVIPIQEVADAMIATVPWVLEDKFHIGNLYSEIRAKILSRIAGDLNLLVMGTGNWDEDYVLGYFTKRGDGAVDNNILGRLPKRLVRLLARVILAPIKIIQRVPTAGLWFGQTDEGELGFSYELAESVWRGIMLNMGYQSIATELGCSMELIEKIVKMNERTQHKRELPLVGGVTLVYR